MHNASRACFFFIAAWIVPSRAIVCRSSRVRTELADIRQNLRDRLPPPRPFLAFRGGCSSSPRLESVGAALFSSFDWNTTSNPLEVSDAAEESETRVWNDGTDNSRSYSPYHLVWSPGVLPRMLVTTAVMMLVEWGRKVVFASPSIGSFPPLYPVSHCFFVGKTGANALSLVHWSSSNVLLPLGASACCLVQVAVNLAFAGAGCSGLNTLMGPFRGYFLGILLYVTLQSTTFWPIKTTIESCHGVGPGRYLSIFTIIGRWSIALLPEAVHFWNRWHQSKQSQDNIQRQGREGQLTEMQEFSVEIIVPTMGCVACIQKIVSSIQVDDEKKASDDFSRLSKIQRVTANLGIPLTESALQVTPPAKGGIVNAIISVPSASHTAAAIDRLVETIEQAGFPNCQIHTVKQIGP
jgi:hypothetical protein